MYIYFNGQLSDGNMETDKKILTDNKLTLLKSKSQKIKAPTNK